MRVVKKKQTPESLTKWIEEYRVTHDGQYPEYKHLKRRSQLFYGYKLLMFEEQGGLCCYCMKKLNGVQGDFCHVEHFIPRNYDEDKFLGQKHATDYQNMFLSCQGENRDDSDVKNDWCHCGRQKENVYDEYLLSPTSDKIGKSFKFLINGKIVGRTKEGKHTIEVCNLNCVKLVRLRAAAIDEVIKAGLNDKISIEDLLQKYSGTYKRTISIIVDAHWQNIEIDAFYPYCNAITYVLSDWRNWYKLLQALLQKEEDDRLQKSKT